NPGCMRSPGYSAGRLASVPGPGDDATGRATAGRMCLRPADDDAGCAGSCAAGARWPADQVVPAGAPGADAARGWSGCPAPGEPYQVAAVHADTAVRLRERLADQPVARAGRAV